MKIKKLTQAQKDAIPAHIEKWIKIGLCTDEADWETSKLAIDKCYEFSGLKPPKTYVKVQSPLALALAAPISSYLLNNLPNEASIRASVGSSVKDSVWDSIKASIRASVWGSIRASVEAPVGSLIVTSVWDSVLDSVRDSVGDSVMDSVRGSIRDSIKDSVRDSIVASVAASVWDSVETSIRDSVKESVWAPVKASVMDSVMESVEESVEASVGALVRASVEAPVGESKIKKHISNNWQKYFGGQFWVSWQAFESFFHDECGLKLPGNLSDRARAYREAEASSSWWWPHTDFVMVCNRPKYIHMENGRLHSATELAIQWRDGWGIAAWHGTRIPNAWILDRHPTAAELLKHENIEQRRAGFELIGWDKLLSQLDHALIDSHPNPEIGDLIEINLPDSGKERFIKVQCGTGRTFVLPVPNEMNTIIQAQAWSYGFDNPNEFLLPEIRT